MTQSLPLSSGGEAILCAVLFASPNYKREPYFPGNLRCIDGCRLKESLHSCHEKRIFHRRSSYSMWSAGIFPARPKCDWRSSPIPINVLVRHCSLSPTGRICSNPLLRIVFRIDLICQPCPCRVPLRRYRVEKENLFWSLNKHRRASNVPQTNRESLKAVQVGRKCRDVR